MTAQPKGGRLDRARGRRHRFLNRSRGDRGATLVEYALGVALVCIASIGAIQFTQDAATDEFDDRADRSGAPDLLEVTDGGTTGGGTTGGSDGTDSEVPPTEVFFNGFTVKTSGNNPWTAKVEVHVIDGSNADVEGAQVVGTWTYLDGSTPVTQNVTCLQTNHKGICLFQLSDIPNAATNVTFTMTTIEGGVPPVIYNGTPEEVCIPRTGPSC